MKKYASLLVGCSVLLIGAGCASSAPYSGTSGTSAPPASSGTAPSVQKNVSISGFSFQPSSVTVKAGTTVIWTNQDPPTHTVTADDGSFDSGSMASHATYNHTFTHTGTFSYHCSIHPSMKATVIVQ